MNVLSLLLGAALAAAQPAADTVDAEEIRDGIALDAEPAYCKEAPIQADGVAPRVEELIVPVAAHVEAEPATPPVAAEVIERLLERSQRNLTLGPTGPGNLLWRPGADPDEGLYLPLDVRVDACMVPTLISRPPQLFPPDVEPLGNGRTLLMLNGRRLENENSGD
jgi:hypothetical protein